MTIALAFFIAGTQSGAVIVVTRISPSLKSSISSGFSMTWARPAALPGLAGRPFATILRSVVVASTTVSSFSFF